MSIYTTSLKQEFTKFIIVGLPISIFITSIYLHTYLHVHISLYMFLPYYVQHYISSATHIITSCTLITSSIVHVVIQNRSFIQSTHTISLLRYSHNPILFHLPILTPICLPLFWFCNKRRKLKTEKAKNKRNDDNRIKFNLEIDLELVGWTHSS